FEEDTLVAVCGAEFEGTFPHNRPVLAPAGSRYNVGRTVRGARAYLAVAGGFAVEPVLGSRSTYLPGRFGGFQGRALRHGDVLPLRDSAAASRFSKLKKTRHGSVRWSAPPLTLADHRRLSAERGDRLRRRAAARAARARRQRTLRALRPRHGGRVAPPPEGASRRGAQGHRLELRQVKRIDINCDMGESYGAWKMGADAEVMPYISSANIACGFHGGDPATIRQTVKLAVDQGVAIGAHPSLPDLQGFGRRVMRIP